MKGKAIAFTLMFLLSLLGQGLNQSPTTMLAETTNLFQAGDTVDCGTNASNVSFEVESSQQEYNTGDTFEGWADVYCGVWNETYMVNWSIVVEGYSFPQASGQSQFETNASTVSYHSTHTDHMNENEAIKYYLSEGNWTFYATLSVDDGAGGWSSLFALQDDFTVSENLSTTACGYDTQQIDLMNSTPSAEILPVGDAWSVWIYVNCHMFTTDNNISYVLTNHNNSTYGSLEWHHNYSMESMGSVCDGYCYPRADSSGWFYQRMFVYGHNEYSPLPEGFYDFNLTASYYNNSAQSWEVVDELSLEFEVWNNSGFPEPGPDIDDAQMYVTVAEENYTDEESITGTISLENLVEGEEYIIDYFLSGTGNGTTSINFTATSDNHVEQVVYASLDAGQYCLSVNLDHVDETGWVNNLFYAEDCFTVTATSTNEECDPPAHENTSTLTVVLDQTTYEENESMVITLTMTCPATNGDRMYFQFWVEDENGELVGSLTEDFWDSTSDDTVVYTYNTTAYTGSGSGEYTLYSEYSGDVLADFDFLDDDTVSFTIGDIPNSELCVIYDEQGNEFEDYIYAPNAYNNSDFTENGNITYGLPYQAEITTICSTTGGAVNQIRLWIEAEATGETTDVDYVEWTSTDGAGYEYIVQDNSVIDMGPGTYILYAEYHVALDGMNFEFVDDDYDMVIFETVETDTDGDGVLDEDDQCPDTQIGVTVNPVGCEEPPEAENDEDGDGVADENDQCPNTPAGSTVDTTGCVPDGNSWSNVPPVVSAVIISPNLPMADEALTCAFMAFDADDDEVTTTLEWKVNGNVIAADVDTIESGYSAGDDVVCTVVGWDGQAYGNTDADSVTILASADDIEAAAQGIPALGTIGTLLAIAFGVGLTRRLDD